MPGFAGDPTPAPPVDPYQGGNGAISPAAQLGGGPLNGGQYIPGTLPNGGGFDLTPLSPEYASQVQQAYSAPSGLDQAIGVYQGYYGPQLSALQSERDNVTARQYAQGLYYGQSQDAAQRQYAASMGLLGVDRQGNAIQQQDIGNLLGLYNQQYGLQRSLYDSQNATARAQAERQKFDINSQATSRGAWGSEGQLSRLNTTDELMRQAIQGNEAQYGIQANQTDISKERLSSQQRELQNQASSYGLKADQLKANLDSGLAKMGLDNIMSSMNLMDMLSSNDIQQATLARTIIDSALNTPQNVLDYLQQNPDLLSSLLGGNQSSTSLPINGGPMQGYRGPQ